MQILNKIKQISSSLRQSLSKKLVIKEYNLLFIGFGVVIIFLGIFLAHNFYLGSQIKNANNIAADFKTKLLKIQSELTALENEDQVKKNKKLQEDIGNIHDNYKALVSSYEDLLDLKTKVKDTADIDKLLAQALNYLSEKNYSSASANIVEINSLIKIQNDKIVSSFVIPQSVPVNNQAPGAGYSRQSVKIDDGTFLVDIIAGDLGSTKVIVDTASDSDCSNNCPVLSLADYVSRSGAYAGINGSYFCPAEYPSCAGKTNSFDLLVMNKNKHYFNSDNNVYSTNPAVIFTGGSARFVGQALQWGRDTGVDAVLSNYPLLVSGGNVSYSGGGDPKFAPKGPRGFVANKGNTAYIGVISNASMEDAAKVLKAMGMENAMNLDEGGSTALWSGGYKMGPGRNIPNAILFIKK